MRTIVVVLGIAYVVLFGHTYHTIVPLKDFPVGHVIQANEFRRSWFGSTDVKDFATDPRQVVEHKVISPLHAGSNIHLSEISR